MRKRLVSVVVLLVSLFTSCGKNDTSGCQPVPVASEKAQMVAFCNANNINYSEDASGLLYQIITPGSLFTPISTSTVSVTYTGKLFNGTVFDSTSSPVMVALTNVIDGWKIGIPLIKKGGRIKLIIPSALAYSCSGSGNGIPPNSPLFFDVTLLDVK